jgi:uncharacterized membrane protein YczE
MRITRRLAQLFTGLVLYGISMALLVESRLGLDPWDVFHQGISKVTGLSFGLVVILTGIPVLLLWVPLRQRPGFGTLANLIVVGLVADRALALLPPGTTWAARIGYLAGGIVLNAAATGLYIGSRFGPGPRDAGFLLGGTVGIGTVAYALGIGPLVQVFLRLFDTESQVSDHPDTFASR